MPSISCRWSIGIRPERTRPWTWFLQQTTDYDEFQPWNVRVVASSGFGYRLRDDEITTLTVRLGGGCRYTRY